MVTGGLLCLCPRSQQCRINSPPANNSARPGIPSTRCRWKHALDNASLLPPRYTERHDTNRNPRLAQAEPAPARPQTPRMKLADILDSFDWQVITRESTHDQHDIAAAIATCQRWAAEADKHLAAIDEVFTATELPVKVTALLVTITAPNEDFQAEPDNPLVNQAMEDMVKTIRVLHFLQQDATDLDWETALQIVAEQTDFQLNDDLPVRKLEAAEPYAQAHYELWGSTIAEYTEIAPREPDRAGTLLFQAALRGRADLTDINEAEIQQGGGEDEQSLDIRYGTMAAMMLMWIREHFNRELETPSKLG